MKKKGGAPGRKNLPNRRKGPNTTSPGKNLSKQKVPPNNKGQMEKRSNSIAYGTRTVFKPPSG